LILLRAAAVDVVTGDDAEEVQEQNKALQHGAEPVLSQQRRCIGGGQ